MRATCRENGNGPGATKGEARRHEKRGGGDTFTLYGGKMLTKKKKQKKIATQANSRDTVNAEMKAWAPKSYSALAPFVRAGLGIETGREGKK